MAYFKKAVKKVLRAGKKFARKRYMTKTGGVKVKQVVKDVALLKKMVNVEKKELQLTNGQSPVAVGQCVGNTDGAFALEITPMPSQGDGFNQRNGRSIKYCSMNMNYAISSMSGQQSGVKVRIDIIETREDFGTLSNIFGTIWEPNQFSGFRDANAQRNPNYFGDYKFIRTKYVYLSKQQIAGKESCSIGRLGLKLDRHIRFLDNTNTFTGNRYFMVVRTDRGNASLGTVCSTAGFVVDKAINTGINFYYDINNYYIDN